MSDYISREATIEFVKRQILMPDQERDMVMGIKAIPTADVAPVRRGRWNKSGPLQECQCCGEVYSQLGGNAGKSWNYCPNCGADMREDEE